MSEDTPPEITRRQVACRFLLAVGYMLVLHLVKLVLIATALFQHVFVLITLTSSEPARQFANRLAAYGYRVMRYITLNDAHRPFPFQEFPPELEPPAEIRFD
jgi:hypothetical protein